MILTEVIRKVSILSRLRIHRHGLTKQVFLRVGAVSEAATSFAGKRPKNNVGSTFPKELVHVFAGRPGELKLGRNLVSTGNNDS